MFTVTRLGIDGRLAKTLTTSNPIESMISIARTTNRNVTRWRDGQMVLRWTAAGMLNAERSFRRIKGYKQMPQLVDALRRHAHPDTAPTPNLSVPPPRVHRGSSPKFHATRDMPLAVRRRRFVCLADPSCDYTNRGAQPYGMLLPDGLDRPALPTVRTRRENDAMDLPVMPPVSPMLSKSVASLPPDASYEPKWDGFRSICFHDGDEVELGSRNERPMTRYFPEIVAAAISELPNA